MPALLQQRSPREVDELLKAGQSPRYRELDVLQRMYDCTFYNGRPLFFDNTVDVPIQERKPCVIYPSCAIAIESHVSFTLGEGKFPAITSLASEDDSGLDGLSKTDSTTLDGFNDRFAQTAQLEAACRQLLRMGMSSKSAGAVLGFRKGQPTVEPLWAKVCTPTFNPQDPDEVISLEVSYRYTEAILDTTTGQWVTVVWQYRRLIDAQSDTTFVPVQVLDRMSFPKPSAVDKTRTVLHGFGFCPVVWWKCMATAEGGSGFDGHAIHERITDAIQALDFSLSQRQRAALYCGDPQWCLSGVDPNVPFAPQGRAARIQPTPDNPTGDMAKAGQWGGAMSGYSGGGTTKKGPGVVWASDNPDAKFALVTLPGDALAAIDSNANDLMNKICESMHVVRVDPVALRGTADISAKAMVLMYARQLGRVAELRSDFGSKCILAMLSLFYRMMLAKPAGLYIPGLKKVLPVLAKCLMTVAGGVKIWIAPKLKLKWPEYFEPSDADEATRVTNAQAAYDAKFITLQSAVEHIKAVFNISNVDQYIDALKKEAADRQADAIANAQAMAKAAPPITPTAGMGQKPGVPPPNRLASQPKASAA